MKRIRVCTLALFLAIGTGVWFMIPGKVHAAGDADFSLSPVSGTYTTGSTITVYISETSSGGNNTNAVQVNLSFPSSLTWQGTSLTGPFTLCAQNDHSSTSVSLACAATAAQSGTQAIATVTFTAASAGVAHIALIGGSDIDSTGGSSVWNGTLPSAAYTIINAPAGGGSSAGSSSGGSSPASGGPKPSPAGGASTSNTATATPVPGSSSATTTPDTQTGTWIWTGAGLILLGGGAFTVWYRLRHHGGTNNPFKIK